MNDKSPLLEFDLTHEVYTSGGYVIIKDKEIKIEVSLPELKAILQEYLNKQKEKTYE